VQEAGIGGSSTSNNGCSTARRCSCIGCSSYLKITPRKKQLITKVRKDSIHSEDQERLPNEDQKGSN